MDSKRRILSKALTSGLGLSSFGALGLTACMAPLRKAPEPIPDAKRLSELITKANEQLTSRSNEPKLKVGQAWEFQTTNLYNGVSLGAVLHRVEATNSTGHTLALIDENGTRLEIFKERWKLSQEAHHDATLRFEQPVALIPSRLDTGFEERYSTRYRVVPKGASESVDTTFRNLYWNVYVEVNGWETLQVPAGRFEVARIRRRIFFNHFDSFRSESTRVETLWYSPKLSMWVAREWTGQYLPQGSRRRGGLMREDWVRWELQRVLAEPIG
jgi:hypothetical protein